MGPRFGSPRKQTLRQNLVFGSFYEQVSVRSTPVEGRGKKQEWAEGEVKLEWRSSNDLG